MLKVLPLLSWWWEYVPIPYKLQIKDYRRQGIEDVCLGPAFAKNSLFYSSWGGYVPAVSHLCFWVITRGCLFYLWQWCLSWISGMAIYLPELFISGLKLWPVLSLTGCFGMSPGCVETVFSVFCWSKVGDVWVSLFFVETYFSILVIRCWWINCNCCLTDWFSLTIPKVMLNALVSSQMV